MTFMRPWRSDRIKNSLLIINPQSAREFKNDNKLIIETLLHSTFAYE